MHRPRRAADGHLERFGCTYGHVTIDVEAAGSDLVAVLHECLTPAIRRSPFGSGDVVVRASVDPVKYEDIASSLATAATLPVFALDRGIVHLPGRVDQDVTSFLLARHGIVCRLHPEVIEVVAASAASRGGVGLMRVIREAVIARRLHRTRCFDVHAAAIEIDGQAILFTGPKYSGKTTALAFACLGGRARVVANDRVLLTNRGGTWTAEGVPTLVSIRSGTAGFFPALTGPTAAAFAQPGTLTVAALAKRLGTSAIPSAPLAALVRLEVDRELDGWQIDECGANERAQVLAGSRYGQERVASPPTVFELQAQTDASHAPAVDPRDIADTVRVFRCRLGARAYDRDAGEFLRAFLGDDVRPQRRHA